MLSDEFIKLHADRLNFNFKRLNIPFVVNCGRPEGKAKTPRETFYRMGNSCIDTPKMYWVSEKDVVAYLKRNKLPSLAELRKEKAEANSPEPSPKSEKQEPTKVCKAPKTPVKETKGKREAEKAAEDFKPIDKLGNGSNVYYRTDKLRVNDFTSSKVKNAAATLNVSIETDDFPEANLLFDNIKDAVLVAKRINKDYPKGIPSVLLLDKYVKNFYDAKEKYWQSLVQIKPKQETESPKAEPIIEKVEISYLPEDEQEYFAEVTAKSSIDNLADALNDVCKSNGMDFTVKDWQGKRIYLKPGHGSTGYTAIYDSKKVKQNVYIDLASFEVKCYTESNQPYAWNSSQNDRVVKGFAPFAKLAKALSEFYSKPKAEKQSLPKQVAKIQIGRETTIETSSEKFEGVYALMPINKLVPSHNFKTFSRNPNYPAGCQERQYHDNKQLQQNVMKRAENLNPLHLLNEDATAESGPPIVTKDGVVLGGNSRAMILLNAHEDFPENWRKYQAALNKRLALYDLPADHTIGAPVLVRMVDVDMKRCLHYSSILNTSLKNDEGIGTKSMSYAKEIPEKDLKEIGEYLAAMEVESLAQIFDNETICKKITKTLRTAGVINDTNVSVWLVPESYEFTQEAKMILQNIFVGVVLQDKKLIETAKNYTDKIITAIPFMLRVKSYKGKWNITKNFENAIKFESNRRSKKLEKDQYLKIKDVFGNNPTEMDVLAWDLLDLKPTEFKKAMRRYTEAADNQLDETPGFFEKPKLEPIGVIRDILGKKASEVLPDNKPAEVKAVKNFPHPFFKIIAEMVENGKELRDISWKANINMSGNGKKELRREIMTAVAGKKLPYSESTANKLYAAVLQWIKQNYKNANTTDEFKPVISNNLSDRKPTTAKRSSTLSDKPKRDLSIFRKIGKAISNDPFVKFLKKL